MVPNCFLNEQVFYWHAQVSLEFSRGGLAHDRGICGAVRLGNAGQVQVTGCHRGLGVPWGVVRSDLCADFMKVFLCLSTCPVILRACLLCLGNIVALEKEWVPPETRPLR